MTPALMQAARWWANAGVPIFPISVRLRDGKWVKTPLTKHGHLDASFHIDSFHWTSANGFGLVMGAGWYALDVDSHKEGAEDSARAWVKAHGVPNDTRLHKTPSGGWHLIFRLPKGYEMLRTRANIVPGLDSRGAGGWIAFAEGYSVVRATPPALLPVLACKALDEGREPRPEDAPLQPVWDTVASRRPVDVAAIQQRLASFLRKPGALRNRWQGGTLGLADASRSGRDMSMARLLAMHGLTAEEIVWVLLAWFEHGQARYLEKGGERSAQRCAARAVAAHQAEEAAVRRMMRRQANVEDDAAMAALISALSNGASGFGGGT